MSVLEPVVLMPVLWAELVDDDGAAERLHEAVGAEWGWRAVAGGWARLFVASCEETEAWGEDAAAEAAATRSRMVGTVLDELDAAGADTRAERAAVAAVAAGGPPDGWAGVMTAGGLSDGDAAWGLSRLAVVGANAVAVLLEGRGSWGLAEGSVPAEDERAAARRDAFDRIRARIAG